MYSEQSIELDLFLNCLQIRPWQSIAKTLNAMLMLHVAKIVIALIHFNFNIILFPDQNDFSGITRP